MDAVKFLEETRRMCDTYDVCEGCPANARGNVVDCRVDIMQAIDAADAVAVVEKWSEEHPRKTRQSVFLEQWPEAEIDKCGCLVLCPKRVSADYRSRYANCANRVCGDCSREFWMQEVEQ